MLGLIGVIVGMAAGAVTILVDGRQIRWPHWLSGRKWWKAILVFVVAGAISTGLTLGGYLMAHRTSEAKELGGVDLSGYCASYEFKGAQQMGCQSPINLGDACDKRWDREDDTMKFTDPNDPNSGVCITASGRDTKKGVDNLPGYCHHKYPLTHKVTARSSPPHSWVCRTSVDPTLVCSWQYQSRDAVARKDDADKQWKCYEEKQL
ncbi:hypothetical protein [Streptomyces endophyticus]|uniref:Uncharacterized protein n=1 Tax=Streptomyces endophyticus TaxID=714166 RepID=A0ABU6FLC6_9ACTN|nr:hypothetical protein [Streptomyces endophyticus]MEB8344338.1 hypothetical protein [Streptomyces endophyticus]